jgi:hypothetical protein
MGAGTQKIIIKEILRTVGLKWRFGCPLAGQEKLIFRASYEVWTNVENITWISTHSYAQDWTSRA